MKHNVDKYCIVRELGNYLKVFNLNILVCLDNTNYIFIPKINNQICQVINKKC